jgi:hypothetical protein
VDARLASYSAAVSNKEGFVLFASSSSSSSSSASSSSSSSSSSFFVNELDSPNNGLLK